MSTKRRLEIMPEVLPAPSRAGTSPVRSRTLARLKVLAALGAAGLAASCGKTEDGGGGGGGGGIDGGLPDGGYDAGEDAYGVVDPLPPPACFRNAVPTATASYFDPTDAGTFDAGAFDGGAGQGRLVDVVLTFQQSGVVLGTVSSPDGITLYSQTPDPYELVLHVPEGLPDSQGTVRIQTSCSTGPTALVLALTFTDDTVTVAVHEQTY